MASSPHPYDGQPTGGSSLSGRTLACGHDGPAACLRCVDEAAARAVKAALVALLAGLKEQ